VQLCNYLETGGYIRSVSGQHFGKHVSAEKVTHARGVNNVLPVRSAPRSYYKRSGANSSVDSSEKKYLYNSVVS
jgi:hypothetical protein